MEYVFEPLFTQAFTERIVETMALDVMTKFAFLQSLELPCEAQQAFKPFVKEGSFLIKGLSLVIDSIGETITDAEPAHKVMVRGLLLYSFAHQDYHEALKKVKAQSNPVRDQSLRRSFQPALIDS